MPIVTLSVLEDTDELSIVSPGLQSGRREEKIANWGVYHAGCAGVLSSKEACRAVLGFLS